MIEWLAKIVTENITSIRIDYDNGGFLTADKTKAFVRYNNGDLVWFEVIEGNWEVVGVTAHDESCTWRRT